ncbi:uncharacterized protein LOC126979321 [Leptidea sinapis]|uniref:uncharacterized protein LOC126979321 n=1 Tax=Leptidea sinapis TaxID=189913 RepID=UPI0021C26B0F|nr:uncharacterized protein LOC126979321 [Leptidea sinapis]
MNWEEYGIKINGGYLNHLRFADDLILFSENGKNLEVMLQQLAEESMRVGLSMNTEKTKIMTNSDKIIITVNNEPIEYVEEYIYLGQVIATKESTEKEINRRVTNTWKKYWSLKEVMKNGNLYKRQEKSIQLLHTALTYLWLSDLGPYPKTTK